MDRDRAEKRRLWRAYHVTRRVAQRGHSVTPQDGVREFNQRVAFARRYYRGTYDARHFRWMQMLSKRVIQKPHYGLDMSLDAYALFRQFVAP